MTTELVAAPAVDTTVALLDATGNGVLTTSAAGTASNLLAAAMVAVAVEAKGTEVNARSRYTLRRWTGSCTSLGFIAVEVGEAAVNELGL